MAEWAEAQVEHNKEIQAQNESIKKQRDDIISKGNETAFKNTITQFLGKVMGDMTAESRRMVMKWCGCPGHKKKPCWYYDATKTHKKNKKVVQEKLKQKQK
jgi:hypothetical protein